MDNLQRTLEATALAHAAKANEMSWDGFAEFMNADWAKVAEDLGKNGTDWALNFADPEGDSDQTPIKSQ